MPSRRRRALPMSKLFELYEVDKALPLVGAGANGEVSSVRRKADGRQLALKTMKVLSAQSDDPGSAISDLLRDVGMQASVEHPNVCRVVDVFVDRTGSGAVSFTMPFCTGGSLADLIGREPDRGLDEATIVRLARGMLAALACCHRHGICHRDVKLDNFVLPFARPDAQPLVQLMVKPRTTSPAESEDRRVL